jgi:hypothetical protein
MGSNIEWMCNNALNVVAIIHLKRVISDESEFDMEFNIMR